MIPEDDSHPQQRQQFVVKSASEKAIICEELMQARDAFVESNYTFINLEISGKFCEFKGKKHIVSAKNRDF